jgi:hypothetical protein
MRLETMLETLCCCSYCILLLLLHFAEEMNTSGHVHVLVVRIEPCACRGVTESGMTPDLLDFAFSGHQGVKSVYCSVNCYWTKPFLWTHSRR